MCLSFFCAVSIFVLSRLVLRCTVRFLRNFIRFLNSNLSNLSSTFLMAYILSFKNDMPFREKCPNDPIFQLNSF
jgi:hypothetical protein